MNEQELAVKNYFDNRIIQLETVEGQKECSLRVPAPYFPPPLSLSRIYQFVIPEGYVRHDFSTEIIANSQVGQRPYAEWVDPENPKDGRIRIYVIAYPLYTDGRTEFSSVKVFDVTGIKDNS